MTDQSTQSSGAIRLDPAKQYKKDATLSEIFGADVQEGRVLLDEITKAYRAPCLALSSID